MLRFSASINGRLLFEVRQSFETEFENVKLMKPTRWTGGNPYSNPDWGLTANNGDQIPREWVAGEGMGPKADICGLRWDNLNGEYDECADGTHNCASGAICHKSSQGSK